MTLTSWTIGRSKNAGTSRTSSSTLWIMESTKRNDSLADFEGGYNFRAFETPPILRRTHRRFGGTQLARIISLRKDSKVNQCDQPKALIETLEPKRIRTTSKRPSVILFTAAGLSLSSSASGLHAGQESPSASCHSKSQ